MNPRATAIYYGLASFVLATAIFVLQPSGQPAVANLQAQVRQSFSIAWQQTLGDQPYFTQVADIYAGTTEFYNQASIAMAQMIDDPNSDQAMAQVFGQVYNDFADLTAGQRPQAPTAVAQADLSPGTFMTQAPIFNIIPDNSPAAPTGTVSGASTDATSAAILPSAVPAAGTPSLSPTADGPWFTATDGVTGEQYCVAIYDGNVNKYLGPCANEYH